MHLAQRLVMSYANGMKHTITENDWPAPYVNDIRQCFVSRLVPVKQNPVIIILVAYTIDSSFVVVGKCIAH